MNSILNIKSLLVVALLLVVSPLLAGPTANQTVTFEVQAINEIAVSGDPGAMTINAAVAGQAPTLVSDTSTTYSYTSNETRKITGAINTAMPTGVTLTVALVAPSTGLSAGDVPLAVAGASLVTSIEADNETALGITYKLSATAEAGVVTSAAKTVTLTIASEL